MQVVVRLEETWTYVNGITDPKERLLTEYSVARTISFLAADEEYRNRYGNAPLDLLLYTRAIHAILRESETLQGIRDGKLRRIEDIDPFPLDV